MILLGTTGWESNCEKLDKAIYPAKYRENKLQYYSQFSSLVELRSTFYEVPDKATVQLWDESTPKKFEFIGRMLKDITHNRERSIDPKQIENYFDALGSLGYKLSMVILHFNRHFQKTKNNREFLLNLLDEVNKHFRQHVSIELIHGSWFGEDENLLTELRERSSSLINTDKRTVPPAIRHPEVNFLRLRGDPSVVPVDSFGKNIIDRQRDIDFYAMYLKSLQKSYKVIFVTIDNHFSGNAWKDAQNLADAMRKQKVKFRGFHEQKEKIPQA